MRNIIFVLTALVLSVSAAGATSKTGAPAKSKAAKKAPKKNLTQEAVFNGATVNGKYQIAGGAVTAVENEKSLNDIIGGRKDFKDRLKQDLAKAPKKDQMAAE